MHIHKLGISTFKYDLPLAITIGNFDGLHLGHKYVLEYLVDIAKKNNLHSAVLSFYPHPRNILSKNNQKILQIDTFYQKINKILKYVNIILIAKFDFNLSIISAKEFIQNLFDLNVKYIVVGNDFYFGHKRSANALDLKSLALEYGITVEILPLIANITNEYGDLKQQKFSSSQLRLALQQADFKQAKKYMGEDFYYIQRVSKGKQIGRTLGFPTINLKVSNNFILPCGIYAVKVLLISENKLLNAVASLGYRPTIRHNNTQGLLLEVHILDWQGDLYNKKVKVIFLHKLRDENFYPCLEQMQQAIKQDIHNAKYYF